MDHNVKAIFGFVQGYALHENLKIPVLIVMNYIKYISFSSLFSLKIMLLSGK